MLFLPTSIYETRRRLLKQKESGKLSDEEFSRRLLEIDPHDHIALVQLGFAAEEASDFAAAESYYWRAIDGHPWDCRPYLGLSRILSRDPSQTALGSGLAELGIRKLLLDEDRLKSLDSREFAPDIAGLEQFKNLKPREQLFLMAQALAASRALEPAEVADRLRPYRLAHDVYESPALEPETVDAIARERERITPLLVGLLRGYAQNYVEDDHIVERTLALLGEIGHPSILSALTEFAEVDNDAVAGPAVWAIHQVIARDPQAALNVLVEIAPTMSIASRTAVAVSVLRRPDIDPAGAVLVRLAADLKRFPKEDRDEFLPFLLHVLLSGRGPQAVMRAREILSGNANLLSGMMREFCHDLIQRLESGQDLALPADPERPFTVYDICAGEIDWDEEDEEEDLDSAADNQDRLVAPPPPRRSQAPGRNDPCWCGSGKKYKKCHLDADQGVERRR